MIAIDVLRWPGVNQALIVSFIGAVALSMLPMIYGLRRPKGSVFTWGEAMLGSTYVFAVLFVSYGIVPHQWIDHADKLGWSRDKFIFGPFDLLKPQSMGGWNPITLQYEAVRDIIVVLIHAFFFGLHMFLAIWWQGRYKEATKELPTSTYGRPLVKKA